MSSATAAVRAPLSRVETGVLVGRTMGLVALTSGFFALGAYIGRAIVLVLCRSRAERSSTRSAAS